MPMDGQADLWRYQDRRSPKCPLNRGRARWTEAEFTYYYICTTTGLFCYYIFLWLNYYLSHRSAITDIIIHIYYPELLSYFLYCT